ncbi:hypothetical protein HDV04_003187 [Boothiomyces sp. JEL0838]|nr:hypothetical protein HDV04_003187 [Boothiomyces sp. JEL0838]
MYNQNQQKLTFSQIDLDGFLDKSNTERAKLYLEKTRVLMGLFKLVSIVNLIVSVLLTTPLSVDVAILVIAVVVTLIDWVVQVIQAGQVLKRDYVADIFINKIAYEYYVMTSYRHYCFYRKVNSQLPAKCQGRIGVHRDLSSSFNTFATLFVVVYGYLVKVKPTSNQQMDIHYFYSSMSFSISLVTILFDLLSTIYSALYYIWNRADFRGSLENWCLENITRSLLVLNLVDGFQLEETTTIVLFNAEHAKSYRANEVVFAINLLIPYTILICEIYNQPGFDSSFIFSLAIGYAYLLFVSGRFVLNASRAIQIINNRDLTTLLTHGFTCDFFQLTSFNRYCFIEDVKTRLGNEVKNKLFIYHHCSEFLGHLLCYLAAVKYLNLAYTFIDFDYPLGLVQYKAIADGVKQAGITNKNTGPYGDGRFVIDNATISYYEIYSAVIPANLCFALVIISGIISCGWFYMRSGMEGPTEKFLKERIRTILAPNQSKFRQI